MMIRHLTIALLTVHAIAIGSYAQSNDPARSFASSLYAFLYPNDWQVQRSDEGGEVTITPRGEVQRIAGKPWIAHGVRLYYFPVAKQVREVVIPSEVAAHFERWYLATARENATPIRVARSCYALTVGGDSARASDFHVVRPDGRGETVTLVTIPRSAGVYIVIHERPGVGSSFSEAGELIIGSLRLNGRAMGVSPNTIQESVDNRRQADRMWDWTVKTPPTWGNKRW